MVTEIRDAQRADLPAMLEIYNAAILHTTAIYEFEVKTEAFFAGWFDLKTIQKLPVLVAVQGTSVVGYSTFGPFRPHPGYLHTVENSVYVAEQARSQGVGTLLLARLLQEARKSNVHVVIAGIDATNVASIRLHEKFGFRVAGTLHEVGWKFERWLDLVFLEHILQPEG